MRRSVRAGAVLLAVLLPVGAANGEGQGAFGDARSTDRVRDGVPPVSDAVPSTGAPAPGWTAGRSAGSAAS